jgi:hypothetical protein
MVEEWIALGDYSYVTGANLALILCAILAATMAVVDVHMTTSRFVEARDNAK